MAIEGPGLYQLRVLSARLRAAGTEGQGLRRELFQAVTKAARPLADEIGSAGHLMAYMPRRYAGVLAGDLSVTASKSTGRNPGVSIKARGRVHRRKVVQRDEGRITHPVFARGPRPTWNWETQVEGMRPGFFTDAVEKAAPAVRDQVMAAMDVIGKRLTSA